MYLWVKTALRLSFICLLGTAHSMDGKDIETGGIQQTTNSGGYPSSMLMPAAMGVSFAAGWYLNTYLSSSPSTPTFSPPTLPASHPAEIGEPAVTGCAPFAPYNFQIYGSGGNVTSMNFMNVYWPAMTHVNTSVEYPALPFPNALDDVITGPVLQLGEVVVSQAQSLIKGEYNLTNATYLITKNPVFKTFCTTTYDLFSSWCLCKDGNMDPETAPQYYGLAKCNKSIGESLMDTVYTCQMMTPFLLKVAMKYASPLLGIS